MQNGAEGNSHSCVYQTIWKTDVIGRTLNNGMKPLKNVQIYIYIYIYTCIIPNINKTPYGDRNGIQNHARHQRGWRMQ